MNLRFITRAQWIALAAAHTGYMLDAMDVLLFVFTVNVLRAEFHLSAAQAGLVSSFTLAFSAAGGIGFGVLSDRIGRARALMWLKFSADGFNLFNHPNFDAPNNDIDLFPNFAPPAVSPTTTTWGIIQHTLGSSRFLQLSLRLDF